MTSPTSSGPPEATRIGQRLSVLAVTASDLLTICRQAALSGGSIETLWLVGATGFEPVTSSVSANTRNRCARRRSPRSPPTVDAQGKRSLDGQGNALFPTSCRHSASHYIMPSSCGYAATGWRRGMHSAAVQRVGGCRTPATGGCATLICGHELWTFVRRFLAGEWRLSQKGSRSIVRHAGRPRPDLIDRLVLCCRFLSCPRLPTWSLSIWRPPPGSLTPTPSLPSSGHRRPTSPASAGASSSSTSQRRWSMPSR
jgi:hypothetical protein